MQSKRLTIAFVIIVLLFNSSGATDEKKPSNPRKLNCVDTSIITFCEILGERVSVDDLDRAVRECRLERIAYYRSLYSCKAILEKLDVIVEAIPVQKGERQRLITPCICFLQSLDGEVAGHVIVIDTKGKSQFAIWDENEGAEGKLISKEVLDLPVGTVILVSRSALRLRWLIDSITVVAFVSGIAIIILLRKAFFRFFQRSRRIILFVSLVNISGCSLSTTSDYQSFFDSKSIKIGVVEVQSNGANGKSEIIASPDVVVKIFVLRNRTKEAVKIGSIVTSCSCTVVQDELVGSVVQPGGEKEIPVKINLESKIGAFVEKIFVLIDGLNGVQETLTIEGYARHLPQSDVTNVVFKTDGETPTTRIVGFSYMREKNDPPPELGEYALMSPSQEALESFLVATPIHEKRLGRLGDWIDVWKFSISFFPGKNLSGVATLQVKWDNPKCDRKVELLFGPSDPLELENYFYFRVQSNSVQIESVPVKINCFQEASEAHIESSNPFLKCKLNPTTKRLEFRFEKIPIGAFDVDIRIQAGRTAKNVRVEGISVND